MTENALFLKAFSVIDGLIFGHFRKIIFCRKLLFNHCLDKKEKRVKPLA